MALYDFKKHYILYVDDEQKSLKYFKEAFEERFSILTAHNAAEGYRILKDHEDEIAVLITDQRMPGEKGIQFLGKARKLNRRIVRILVTAYSDLETAIESVNTGAIYKYVTKPWDMRELEMILQRAMEFFLVQKERDQLLQEKISTLYKVMVTDRVLSLGIMGAGLSRHLYNSMTAVKTFLDLTLPRPREEKLDLEYMRNPEFWGNCYRRVQAHMDGVSGVLEDLLGRPQTPLFEFPDKVKLHEIVGESLRLVQGELAQKEVDVENLIPEDLPPLKVDRRKFSLLFELLLRDRVASLPHGASFRLTAQETASPGGNGPEIHVEIGEKEPGPPQGATKSFFDPFFLREGESPKDNVISLMTCFFIVYHHGGTVTRRDGTGNENAFTLTFPLTPPAQAVSMRETDVIGKALLNETLWERVLSEG